MFFAKVWHVRMNTKLLLLKVVKSLKNIVHNLRVAKFGNWVLQGQEKRLAKTIANLERNWQSFAQGNFHALFSSVFQDGKLVRIVCDIQKRTALLNKKLFRTIH